MGSEKKLQSNTTYNHGPCIQFENLWEEEEGLFEEMGVADQARQMLTKLILGQLKHKMKRENCLRSNFKTFVFYQVPREWMNKGVGELPNQQEMDLQYQRITKVDLKY